VIEVGDFQKTHGTVSLSMSRGSQRDVVSLGWPITTSYMSDRLERKR
jgi:hypothetical protein